MSNLATSPVICTSTSPSIPVLASNNTTAGSHSNSISPAQLTSDSFNSDLKFSDVSSIGTNNEDKQQINNWNVFDSDCQLPGSKQSNSGSMMMTDGQSSKHSYSSSTSPSTSSSTSSTPTPTTNFFPETLIIPGSNQRPTQHHLTTILENEDNQLTDSSQTSRVGSSIEPKEPKSYKYRPRHHLIEPLTPPSESELANEEHSQVNYHPMVYQFQGSLYQLKIDPASNRNNAIGNIGYSNDETDYFGDNLNQTEEQNEGGVYESYSIDYDTDYDRYYDDQRANRWVNGAALDGDDADEEIAEIEVSEEMDEEMDVEYDPFDQSKLYYHHYQQQQQLQESGSQSLQEINPGILMPPTYYGFKPDNGHPSITAIHYGNPFAYNLHTIIEESENESSMQTMSSLTSSTLQSLPFESSSSMNACNEDSDNDNQNHKIDETLPNQSTVTTSTLQLESSRQAKYTKSKPMLYDEDEEPEYESVEQHHLSSPSIATHKQSKLERYFTSSLLENSGVSGSVSTVSSKPYPVFPTQLTESTYESTKTSKAKPKQSTTTILTSTTNSNNQQNGPKNSKFLFYRVLDYILNRTDINGNLVDYFNPFDIKMIDQINRRFQIDLIDSLTMAVVKRNPYRTAQTSRKVVSRNSLQTNRLTSQLLALLNCRPRMQSTLGQFSIYDRLINYLVQFKSAHNGVHILMDHRLGRKHVSALEMLNKTDETTSGLEHCLSPAKRSKRSTSNDKCQTIAEALSSSSCIKITINGQSIAICNGNQATNPDTLSSRNPVLYYQPNPENMRDPVYRTVLQINKQYNPECEDRGDGSDDYADYDTLTANTNNAKKLSKFFKLSNPLNRNFLVKFLINETNQPENLAENNQENELNNELDKQKSKLSEKVAKMENEIESSGNRKIANSLLGSLRSRSKERQKMMPCKEITNPDTIYRTHVNGENGKFKTISNMGYSYTQPGNARSSTRQNLATDSTQNNCDTIDCRKRTSKCSKSFRDQRTTSLSSESSTKSNSSSNSSTSHFTWDRNMAGGINRLWNTFRSKSTSSSKSAKNIVVSKDDSDILSASNRNKSFSEPNLHDDDGLEPGRQDKSNATKLSANSNSCSSSTTNLSASGRTKSDNCCVNGQPQQSSKSTPQLTSDTTAEPSRKYRAPQPTETDDKSKSPHKRLTGTASTPSLLYRLSNISTPGSSTSNGTSQQFKRINTLDDSKKGSTLRRSIGASRDNSASEDQSWLNHHQIRQNGTDSTNGPSNNNAVQTNTTPFEKNTKLSKSYREHQETEKRTDKELSNNGLSMLKGSMRSEQRPQQSNNQILQAVQLPPTSHGTVQPRPLQPLQMAPPPNRAITGEILLSIGYQKKFGVLDISVHKCRVYRNIKLDLYVKVYLLPDRNKASKRKTKIKRNTLEPEFNEVLQFLVGSESVAELAARKLWICVWNSDSFGRNGLIGETILELEQCQLLSNGPTYCQLNWFPLMQPATFISSIELKESPEVSGSLFLAIKYQTEGVAHNGITIKSNSGCQSGSMGKLNVLIKEARNLNSLANSNNGTFCKLSLLPEQSKQDHQKSFTVKLGTSPRWNQTFVFDNICREQINARALQITIWYQDKLSSKTFLGGVYLSQNSVSFDEEAYLWNQLLERQNMWVYGEISLRTLGIQPHHG